MKNFRLLFLAALATCVLSACNESEGDYPRYQSLITTVRTLDNGDYYFQRDNGQKLYASDKSRIGTYTPKELQRALIWFNLLPQIEGYDYNLALYAIDEIYTGDAAVVSDAEQLAAMANDPTSIWMDHYNLTKEWLTLLVAYPVNTNSKHNFKLIINEVEQPELTQEGYLNVELRHDDGDDSGSYNSEFYISFNLANIADRLEGKRGMLLRVKTQLNGTQTIRYELSAEK